MPEVCREGTVAAVGEAFPLALWGWAAKRTKVRGGVDRQDPWGSTPPPNPLPQGEGEDVRLAATLGR
jgi:hypothetical protein